MTKQHDNDLWRLSLSDMAAVTQWPFDEALGHIPVMEAKINMAVTPADLRRKMLWRLKRLHACMGHPPVEVMWKAISGGHWANTGVDPDLIRSLWATHKCVVCLMCKRNLMTHSIPIEPRVKRLGEVVATDPVPISIPGYNKEVWIFFFKELSVGYWHAATGKKKSEFPDHLREVLIWYRDKGYPISILRSDDENVLKSHSSVAPLLEEFKVKSQRSVPYMHWQNAVERDVQTLEKQCSAVLHSQTLLPARFWTYVVDHMIRCHNRTPNKQSGDKTPRSAFFPNDREGITDFSNTFNFQIGELVAVGIPKDVGQDWKFDVKHELGVYVGQPEDQIDGCLVYFPYENCVYTRGDVIALDIPAEDLAGFYSARTGMRKGRSTYSELVDMANILNLNKDPDAPVREITVPSHIPPPPGRIGTRARKASAPAAMAVANSTSTLLPPVISCVQSHDSIDDFLDDCWFESSDPGVQCLSQCLSQQSSFQGIPESNVHFDNVLFSDNSIMDNNNVPMSDNDERVPSNDGIHFDPAHAEEVFVNYYMASFAANVAKAHGPNNPTVTQGIDGPESPQWCQAIRDEVKKNIFGMGSIEEVESAPMGALITYFTFVLIKKIKEGREDRFKARSCVRGDLMKGLAETYSPTVASMTTALLQQLAVIDEMHQALVDTVGAFLTQIYPDSATPIYVKFDKKIAAVCGLNPRAIYRIKKYVYGIPDAGRVYYKAYSGLLKSTGYHQSNFDPCLFYKIVNGERLWAWIHVDDTWVAATQADMVEKFAADLRTEFEVTKEPVDNYLGVHYERLPDGSLKKTQRKLLDGLFEQHSVENKPFVKVPIASPSSVPRDETPFDTTPFQSLLGSLIYCLISRPDIGFAVSWGATKAKAPTQSDWRDLMRVLQYLFQTKTKGMIIRKQPKGCKISGTIYVDASYLLYPDSKAQSGFTYGINGVGTFYCKSQKQPVVTTSSSHSEFRAFFTAVCDFIFLELIAKEVGRPFTSPIGVYEDNQPVLTLLERERALPKASKHFVMLINYGRELVAQGRIDPRKIHTMKNFSDIFTKAVYGRDFEYKCQCVLGVQPGEVELEPPLD